jgi:hypothetical protein
VEYKEFLTSNSRDYNTQKHAAKSLGNWVKGLQAGS